MTENHPSRIAYLSFVLLFALLMLIVLLTAVVRTYGDVIGPSVDDKVISIGASGTSDR